MLLHFMYILTKLLDPKQEIISWSSRKQIYFIGAGQTASEDMTVYQTELGWISKFQILFIIQNYVPQPNTKYMRGKM